MNEKVIHICHLCFKSKATVAFVDKRNGEISWYCSLCWDAVQTLKPCWRT